MGLDASVSVYVSARVCARMCVYVALTGIRLYS